MIHASGEYDSIFHTKLDSWTFMRGKLHDLFSQMEIDVLDRAERAFKTSRRTIVFLSFENRYASLGGLAAVAEYLPKKLKAAGEKVVFVTPFHSKHSEVLKAREDGLLKPRFTNQVFHLCDYEGIMTCYEETSSEIPSYHIEVKGSFESGDNPYANDPEKLFHDSLVFSAAIPFALNRLDLTKDLVFHANDWETALITLTSKIGVISRLLNQARTVLTLHNSFDSGFPVKYKKQFFGKEFPGETVLQCAIPLLNGPLTTVSTPFAHELRHDPLQRGVFTDHLQETFSMNPPVGIENGMFCEPSSPFPSVIINESSDKNHLSIIKDKDALRMKFLEELNSINDSRVVGGLKFAQKEYKAPVFFMSGRLDLGQKGFDVIFNAFLRLKRGSAKLFFCPSSRNGGSDLGFFSKIEKKCRGDIVIFPFRISREQYKSFLQGASFLLMPSFYEPFGAATEGLIHGTPILARGTGGLWVQVNPCEGLKVPTMYGSILSLEKKMKRPTGILYREKISDSEAEKNWRTLLDLRPEKRMKSPLYAAMVDAAYDSMVAAINIFKDNKKYAAMIANGIMTAGAFSWDNAVWKYRKVYDAVSFRGA